MHLSDESILVDDLEDYLDNNNYNNANSNNSLVD